ncbi:MAG: hypothetical protein Q4G58_00985 [bacterium]|nr:hypothetical protein [bacterium]
MTETRRIISDKKFLFFVLTIIVLNSLLFVKEQYDVLKEYEITDDVRVVAKEYKAQIKEYQKQPFSEALKTIEESKKKEDGNWGPKSYSMELVITQLTYLSSYDDYLNNIKENKKKYDRASIFADKGSYTYKNIQKTVEDFADCNANELSLENTLGIEAFFKFRLTEYLAIFVLFALCMRLIAERRNGLCNVIHSTPNGRGRLVFKRILILFVASILVNCILYGSNLLLSLYLYGGKESLFGSVQSIERFMKVQYSCTILRFLWKYLAVKCLGGMGVAMLVYMIFSFMSDVTVSMIIIGLFTVIEFILYKAVSIQSAFVFFKYNNLFGVIEYGELCGQYLNINLFGTPVNLVKVLMIIMITVLLLTVMLTMLWAMRSYPNEGTSRLLLAIKRLWERAYVIMTKAHFFGFEMFKSIFFQGGLLVTVLLIFVIKNGMAGDTTKVYDNRSIYLNQFYKDNEGKPVNEVSGYIAKVMAELEAYRKEKEAYEKQYALGKITYAEFEMIEHRFEYIESKENAVTDFQKSVDASSAYENKNKIRCSIVNPNGYERLIGETSFAEHRIFACKAIAFLILYCYVLFAYERQVKSSYILRAAERGRGAFIVRKVLQVVLVSIVIAVTLSGVEFYNINKLYGLPGRNSMLASLAWMRTKSYRITIEQFLMLIVIVRFLTLCCIGGGILSISVVVKKREQALLISLLLLLIPTLLVMGGIKQGQAVSFLLPLSVIELLLKSSWTQCIISYAICLLLGGLGLMVTCRVWNKSFER